MKNFTIVSVLLSVFTVTSFTSLAQPKSDFLKDRNGLEFPSRSYVSVLPYNKQLQLRNDEDRSSFVATENCTSLQFKFAQLIDRDIESIANTYLYNFIDEWWAVRYRYGGTTKRGVDCSSYTKQLAYAVYGVTLPRTAREQHAVATRINRMDIQEGDLVFFNIRGGVSHVGVYIGNDYFTHSSCKAGVTISSLNDPYYSKKYIGAGRVSNEVKEEPILEQKLKEQGTE